MVLTSILSGYACTQVPLKIDLIRCWAFDVKILVARAPPRFLKVPVPMREFMQVFLSPVVLTNFGEELKAGFPTTRAILEAVA